MPEELWTEVHDIIWEAGIKIIPKKKKCKKAKWLSEEALKIPKKRREAKGKGEKKRYTLLDAQKRTDGLFTGGQEYFANRNGHYLQFEVQGEGEVSLCITIKEEVVCVR